MSKDFTLYLEDDVIPANKWVRVGAQLADGTYAETWAHVSHEGMTPRDVLVKPSHFEGTFWLDELRECSALELLHRK